MHLIKPNKVIVENMDTIEPLSELAPKRIMHLSKMHKNYLIKALVLTLVLRLGFLILAYFTDRVLMKHTAPFWDQMLWNTLMHWDARHYLHIAEYGYSTSGEFEVMIAFFPLYPWMVRSLNFFVHHYLLAACLLSWMAAVASAWLFQDLLRLEGYDADLIERALFFFVFFPASIYAVLPYTEALFMTWILLAFWAARKHSWALVGLAGLMACLTRSNGILLLPALLVDFWVLENKKSWPRLFYLGLIPMGIVIYLGLNATIFNDPFAFLAVQSEHWNQARVWPWEQVSFVWSHIFFDPVSKSRAIFYEFRLVAMALSTVLLLAGWRRIRLSWQVFTWGSWGLFMMAKQAISFPRYLFMFFPLYVLLAQWSQRQMVFLCLLCFSVLIQAGWFVLYASGMGAL